MLSTTSAWDNCLGSATWLAEPLRSTLRYQEPLPVQREVIPTVARSLLSGIPMDVSLTAPTGSGKTLCYLLPILQLITQEKAGLDDTRLRALILVPTKALGQQVLREVTRLTRHTNITAVSLCAELESVRMEAQSLVRAVQPDEHLGMSSTPATFGVASSAGGWGAAGGPAHPAAGEEALPQDTDDAVAMPSAASMRYYFSRTDILIATPQRLLRHLDGTAGLTLRALRLLVIDEADQVLAGNFANFVAKVVERFDEEQALLSQHEQQQQQIGQHLRSGASAAVLSMHEGLRRRPAAPPRILHKVLCSATLSSRIGRISEVRLRNCRFIALDTNGVRLDGEGSATAAEGGEKKTAATLRNGLVKSSFALPPTLQEHVVFVEDSYRHAVLLKLVRTIMLKITAQQQRAAAEDAEVPENDGHTREDRAVTVTNPAGAVSAEQSYPTLDRDAGTGILVFCSSAEEARVMGHFLSAAGVRGVVEFTTLATESERRRALLMNCDCVVASDALMRGIDIPNVGHVIMYHAPDSLSQYVHRAGRTARAMRPGHLHLLLSKNGPSGTLEDGEVAAFQALSGLVARTRPLRYERHFFMFAALPAMATEKKLKKAATTSEDATPATRTSDEVHPIAVPTKEGAPVSETDLAAGPKHAEWWVEEANKFLLQSQQQLRVRWASASMLATQSSNYKKETTTGGGRNGDTKHKRPRH